mgnify:CR=1 FL=1
MRLKLLSPGEMSAEQKETYDESIAGKRGAPPAPMMAWLNSPDMARHATRLGEQLRFNTMFPAKLSEIAILVTARHWTSHYEWYAHKRLALKGGMDPKIIDDIRDRRTPKFDDPKGQMIYDLAKSLHEGKGVSKAVDAVNGESVGFGHRVQDGDRVSVYPMFEAFDVTAEDDQADREGRRHHEPDRPPQPGPERCRHDDGDGRQAGAMPEDHRPFPHRPAQ